MIRLEEQSGPLTISRILWGDCSSERVERERADLKHRAEQLSPQSYKQSQTWQPRKTYIEE